MSTLTLALDASTSVGTIAVLRDSSIVAEGEALMRGEREERLLPAICATLASAGCTVHDVGRVVCGAGPGSFTSLRIAAAIAKGMAVGNTALGRETSVFAVSSLALIVAGRRPALDEGRYLALLDAMRGERYAALLEIERSQSIREVEPGSGWRIAERDVAAVCASYNARAIGPGEEIQSAPHARGVAVLLPEILRTGPVSLDSWEPAYGRLAEAQVRWEALHGRSLAPDTE